MKIFVPILLCYLFIPATLVAQQYEYIKKPALGIHFILNDFSSADYIRNYSLGNAFKNGQFGNVKNMNAGLALSYQQGISNHFDFSSSFAGSFMDYTLHNGRDLGRNQLFLETDASLIAKLFSDNHLLDPYLQGGLGVSDYDIWYGAFAQLGMGLQVRLSGEAYLLVNAQYRIGLTEFENNHFFYGIGLLGNLFSRKPVKKSPAHKTVSLPIKQSSDKDGDGVPDSLDACPDVAGLKQYHGCPDTDGDGIPDNLDKCPSIPGTSRYNGCPVPDSDGDGINDENDSCPAVAGVARYHGCPIPDTDGDGVNDEEDKCPNLAGLKENQGCPVVKKEVSEKIKSDAQNIYFETGSYILLPKSYKSLEDVIKILQDDPYLKLDIEGHTDNVGTPEKNQLLSENRTRAVLLYLETKGNVNGKRLSYVGFGLTRPVADNNTVIGRALNRRVEFRLKY